MNAQFEIEDQRYATKEIRRRKSRMVYFSPEDINHFHWHIFANNNITPLLDKEILYDRVGCKTMYLCEGLISLDNYIHENVGVEKNIYRILFNLIQSVLQAEDYLISSANLSLISTDIYIDPDAFHVKLIYCPTKCNVVETLDWLEALIVECENELEKRRIDSDLHYLRQRLSERRFGLESFSRQILEEESRFNLKEIVETRKEGLTIIDQTQTGKSNVVISALKGMTKGVSWIQIFNSDSNKRHKTQLTKGTLLISQIGLTGILATIFYLGLLKAVDFIGVVIVIAGVDLWALKSFNLI